MDVVILDGALVALPGTTETKLHENLQNWVDSGPVLEVIGIPLQVVKCSTYQSEEDTCLMKMQAASATSEPQSILYGGVGGGVVLVIALLVVVVVIIVVAVIKGGKRQSTSINR